MSRGVTNKHLHKRTIGHIVKAKEPWMYINMKTLQTRKSWWEEEFLNTLSRVCHSCDVITPNTLHLALYVLYYFLEGVLPG